MMTRTMRTNLSVTLLLATLAACTGGGPGGAGGAQPAPAAAAGKTGEPATPSAPAPAAAEAGGDAPTPTAADKAEAPLEAYAPVVPDPTIDSTLPCPAGTSQYKGDAVIECRVAGKAGETLSKRQGPSVWFHPNGKVARAGSYDSHEWTGRWWSFDAQGRLESSTAYVAGKEEGRSVNFSPNGKRRSESLYKAGKLEGPSKSWTEDGELMAITVYKDDKGERTTVFKYTMKEATPQEAEAARDELRKLLDEQKKLVEAK